MLLVGACGGPADEDTTPRVQLPSAPPTLTPNPYDPSAIPPAPSADGSVVTYAGTKLGHTGLSLNGRINPRGAPTDYYFEYGPTTAYGTKTPLAALGPKLAAHYTEAFENGPPVWGDGAFGGGDADLRDAKVDVAVRGIDFQANGSELLCWAQFDQARGDDEPGNKPRYSDWAHTGFFLTDHLSSGQWENVSYRLWNDTTQWTHAGANRELNLPLTRDSYVYAPLDEVLRHFDTDFFHLLAYTDDASSPTGSIEFDKLAVTYRNHSLVFPSNGGKLASAPAGSPDDPAALTDGWRVGPGKTWRSAPSPSAPLELVYDFETPVVIQRVQLHQHPQFPSKDVEILASSDGTAWTSVVAGVMPDSDPAGPNFTYLLAKNLVVAPARKLKVRITSGYQPDAWGLGEIEVFGTGAKMKTDDDFYRLNADITGLIPGEMLHYRVVAVNDRATIAGGDQVYEVPREVEPCAVTGTAVSRGTKTKLTARINTSGAEGQISFEFGLDASYGGLTPARPLSPEITPRTVVYLEELSGLPAGAVIHYRVIVQTAGGAVHGDDETFVSE